MHLLYLLLVTTTLGHFLPVKAETTTVQNDQDRRYHLCGEYLATVLSELCHGRYNGPRKPKSNGKHTTTRLRLQQKLFEL